MRRRRLEQQRDTCVAWANPPKNRCVWGSNLTRSVQRAVGLEHLHVIRAFKGGGFGAVLLTHGADELHDALVFALVQPGGESLSTCVIRRTPFCSNSDAIIVTLAPAIRPLITSGAV